MPQTHPFILLKKIDLDSLSLHLNKYIDKADTARPPKWLLDAWTPLNLADTLRHFVRRPSDGAIAKIENGLEGAPYEALGENSDKRQAELIRLDNAVMFWRRGEDILEALPGERREKLARWVESALVARHRARSVESLRFNRARTAELETLIPLSELYGQFWRLLLCLDRHLQGQYEPLAELIERPDFKRPTLTGEERAALRSGPARTAWRKMHRWLKAAASTLARPLPDLPPHFPPPPPPKEKYIYHHFMNRNRFRSCRQVCLALPHVSGFNGVSYRIADAAGIRRGYVDPTTGRSAALMGHQYDQAARYGAVLAENNYVRAIEALTREHGRGTLYVIALPEYYYPRHHPRHSSRSHYNFIGRLYDRLLKNYDMIFISGLEGPKAVPGGGGVEDATPPPGSGERSNALVVYSPGLETHIIDHNKVAVFLNTPLGAIGVSTKGALSSFMGYKEGLIHMLKHAGRDLAYLFVCCMNDDARHKDMCGWLEREVCRRLGKTRLVVTDHEYCYVNSHLDRRFTNNSKMYDKNGPVDGYQLNRYEVDGCGLYSKVFTYPCEPYGL